MHASASKSGAQDRPDHPTLPQNLPSFAFTNFNNLSSQVTSEDGLLQYTTQQELPIATSLKE
jgi:hypothetical protein